MATTPPTAIRHALIIGALEKKGVDFTIFERDTGPDAREQGYRIKVFPDTYLISPELFAEFEATTAGTVMVETSVNAVDGRLLIDEHDQKSPVTVHFADGRAAPGTLLIGAGGGYSQIRRQHVPDHNIIDLRLSVCLYGRTMLTPELEQRIQPKLLRSLVIVRDVAPVIQRIIFDSELPISMFVERMHSPQHGPDRPDLPEDCMYWPMLAPTKLVGFREEIVASALNSKTPKKLALRLSEEWDESTRCLVEMQDETYATSLRVISSTPDLSTWETPPFGTLVGDVIHVMLPLGGVIAATALKDAVALTKALEGSDGGSLASKRLMVQSGSFRGRKMTCRRLPLESYRVLSGF
ncbi:FAD/NAD(P)-binding domain-containing protein [Hypoxylon sp. NC1633]|nr:FAD/NAD(P)-binding domain-containing protein [Hypoxylon sp. NC1633]